ncbi:MAG: hypothetical protein AB7U61_11715, partial [Methylocystis sp.]
DPEPKRTLIFDIDATDELNESGALGFTRRQYANWRRLGSVTFDNAVVSYNGDHVIHFNHPGWRNDRNDPSTAIRRGL